MYAAGLSLHQPRLLEAVDRFVAPSEAPRDALARRGLPARAGATLRALPARRGLRGALARRRRARTRWSPSRLSTEKGDRLGDRGRERRPGVPLRVAGEGPERARLERGWPAGADVSFLGRLEPESVRDAARRRGDGADALALPRVLRLLGARGDGRRGPRRGHRDGRAAGAGRARGCLAPNDPQALAARMRELWDDPRTAQQGEELLARARAATRRSVTWLRCSTSTSAFCLNRAYRPACVSSCEMETGRLPRFRRCALSQLLAPASERVRQRAFRAGSRAASRSLAKRSARAAHLRHVVRRAHAPGPPRGARRCGPPNAAVDQLANAHAPPLQRL